MAAARPDMDLLDDPTEQPGGGLSEQGAANLRAATEAAAAASSLGASLGLDDPELGMGKKVGAALATLQVGRAAKRQKMNHSLFFENDKGLKKILKTFHKVKVHGKGHEYQDLTLLLRHYKKWFQDLHPYGDHFEDLVWKARQVLEDKEKEDDGTTSDPRERLHAFRFQYKNSPADLEEITAGSKQLSDSQRSKIEENRKKAQELKRKKEAEKNGTSASAPQELDMEELWRIEEERAEAERRKATAQGPAANFDMEEEDPFGFGGGFDSSFGGSAPAAKPATKATAPPAFDEEEDPFGFGGGFDDPEPPAQQKPAVTSQAGAAPEAPNPAATTSAPPAFDEEEDPFGFAGGFDEA